MTYYLRYWIDGHYFLRKWFLISRVFCEQWLIEVALREIQTQFYSNRNPTPCAKCNRAFPPTNNNLTTTTLSARAILLANVNFPSLSQIVYPDQPISQKRREINIAKRNSRARSMLLCNYYLLEEKLDYILHKGWIPGCYRIESVSL